MAKEQTGIAGEFWFFSQLHMLGYKAFITFGNTKGIDISVQLFDKKLLTFEVKTKIDFNGSFPYLSNVKIEPDHFIAFIILQSKKELNIKQETGKIFLDCPCCYIVKSKDLHNIAFNWDAKSGSGAKGYGFEAKLLPYLKSLKTKNEEKEIITKTRKNEKGITLGVIKRFKDHHKKSEIDAKLYNTIIWTLAEFEDNYYEEK